VKEIDSGSSPEFIVEGLVTVAAKASVTGGFFAAVTPGDSGQCCFQHLAERTGNADCAAGSAGHRVEDHQRGPAAWRRVESAVDVIAADLQPLGDSFEQSIKGRPPVVLDRERCSQGVERDSNDVGFVAMGESPKLERTSATPLFWDSNGDKS
jgi:hypothetical protein